MLRGLRYVLPKALLLLLLVKGQGAEETARVPQVVAAWAAGPFETRIALDLPVGMDVARSLVGQKIAFDEARPVLSQKTNDCLDPRETRGALRVAAARLEEEGRMLVLTTDPHPRAAVYSLILPAQVQHAQPVEYDLTGVEVSYHSADLKAPPLWSGWWPGVHTAYVGKSLARSAEHARGLALINKPGRLLLNTLVKLPPGKWKFTVAANAPVEATLGGEDPSARVSMRDGDLTLTNLPQFQTESTGEPTLLSLDITTGKADPLAIQLWYEAETSPAGPRIAVVSDQLLVPWTPSAPPAPKPLENVPDLAGGDPLKGAVVFAGAEAKCANCHRVRGQGGIVGPDLSDQVGRDPKSVYRAIYEPSARIHPDYVPYTLALKDGRVLVGTVRAEGADALKVTDTEAKVSTVPRDQLDEFRPSATSIMPVGLAGVIGERNLRDLIAYLTTPAPK